MKNRILKQPIEFLSKIFCLLLFCNTAFTQVNYHFTTYTQEDGITSGTLRSIGKDSTGYIWLLSENGLSRFDGYTFKIFRHSTADTSSISSSDVEEMVVHKSGKILFLTANSISSYNSTTEKFKILIPFQNNLEYKRIFCNSVGFWIIQKSSLIYIDPMTEKITVNNFPKKVPDSNSLSEKDLINFIWLNVNNEITFFNPANKTFSKVPGNYFNTKKQSSQNAPIRYYSDPSGSTYFYSRDGLFKFSQQQQSFLQVSESTLVGDPANPLNGIKRTGNYIVLVFKYDKLCTINMITGEEKTIAVGKTQSSLGTHVAFNGIYPTADGQLWVSTPDHGVFRFNPANGKTDLIKHDEKDQNSLPTNNLEYIFEDRNVVWMASPGVGLIKLEHLKSAFAMHSPYKEHVAKPYELYKNIRTISELDKNNLLIGTLDGMYRFNKTTHAFQSITSPVDGLPLFQNSSVSKILVDTAKNIWICHWNTDGISIINYQSKKVFNINPSENDRPRENTIIRCMYIDSYGYLWLGTNTNLIYRINTKTIDYADASKNHFEKFIGAVTKTDTLIFNATFTIAENKKHEILIGTQNGFYKYSYFTNKFKRFINQPGNPESISDDNIRSFCVDKKGTTWVGTNGGGLNRFDEATQTFKAYTVNNGLPDNSVYSILEDDNGNLWMGTNRGICRFNTATESCRNYSLKDGMQNNEFNTNAACKLSTGELVFGGIKGFNIFNPDSISTTSEIPKIVITQFKVGEKEMAVSTETIRLKHDENYLSFQFAALNYFRNNENKYAYKMEGLDKDWIYSGERRYTNYANLSPGHYIFHVKAANYYGEWNKNDVALKLYISSAWYDTWLFKILVLFFLSSTVYAVFRYRLKQKLKLQEVRNRIASDLHDEIGSTLSSVFIYSEVAQNTNNENKISESNQYLKYISSDVAKMIDALSDIVWTVNSKNDRFENIINRMRASAIELFDAKGYELHLNFDESLNALKLGMAERKNFYLFYKEAINNVVKYADGRNVFITLILSNSKIKLSIQDDGKGFDVIRKSEGNGLNNMKKRAADLKGKFEIHSSADKGTTVHLAFAYS